MSLKVPSSPHVHGGASVSLVMRRVIYALLPAIAVATYLFGWAVPIQLVLASASALLAEALMLRLRKRPVGRFLRDYSAVVTGLLLALSIPAIAPWWLTVVGVFFAIVVAKQLYGGLGYNPFNPAMVGYVMLLISFPKYMTHWPALAPLGSADALGFMDSLRLIFAGWQPLDAVSQATVLDLVKTELGRDHTLGEIVGGHAPLFGTFAGAGGEWVALAYLLGGLWMIHKRVISWHVPAAMLGGTALVAGFFHLYNPDLYPGPLFHLFGGGLMLGAFFIATDPVSSPTTPRGLLIFGAAIGALTYVIRTWGGYPDGVAFSVLLLNMAVPMIDYYTRPTVYGHGQGGSSH